MLGNVVWLLLDYFQITFDLKLFFHIELNGIIVQQINKREREEMYSFFNINFMKRIKHFMCGLNDMNLCSLMCFEDKDLPKT